MNRYAYYLCYNVALIAAFVVLTIKGFFLAWLLVFLLKDPN